MKKLHLNTIESNIGESLGTSYWQMITQDMINQFADLTGDNQRIHVDTEKAKKSPFGSTIIFLYAHIFKSAISRYL